MKKIIDSLQRILLAFWVGGLWVVGFVVAPQLFAHLNYPEVAGMLAGHVFKVMGYIALFAGGFLLLVQLFRQGGSCLKTGLVWLIIMMLLCAALGQFWAQPLTDLLKHTLLPLLVMADSQWAQKTMAWHDVSRMLYLVQSIGGIILVVKQQKLFS